MDGTDVTSEHELSRQNLLKGCASAGICICIDAAVLGLCMCRYTQHSSVGYFPIARVEKHRPELLQTEQPEAR